MIITYDVGNLILKNASFTDTNDPYLLCIAEVFSLSLINSLQF